MNRIEFLSYAKLNLFLEVIRKMEDGYHEIFTLFQTISLADKIIVEKTDRENEIVFKNIDIPLDENNTVQKVIELLKIKKGIKIIIEKNIPVGAGLGGGSSNAGALLLALNNFLELNLSFDKLWTLSRKIGADVPFFLFGGTAIGLNRGDIIVPVKPLEKKVFMLKTPDIKVSTKMIYQNLTEYGDKSKIYAYFLSENFNNFYNRLEQNSFILYPILGEIKEKMSEFCDFVLMSGSGSTIFGGFEDRETAEKYLNGMEEVSLFDAIDRDTYYKNSGASPSGKASVFGADIRRFESSRPNSEKRGDL